MNWMLAFLAAMLLVSIAIGFWRARRSSSRGLFALAWPLPLIVLALAVLGSIKVVVGAAPGSDNIDLAVIAIGTLGVIAALVTWCGALFGGWVARR